MTYKVYIGEPQKLEAWLNALPHGWQIQRTMTLSAGSVAVIMAKGEDI